MRSTARHAGSTVADRRILTGDAEALKGTAVKAMLIRIPTGDGGAEQSLVRKALHAKTVHAVHEQFMTETAAWPTRAPAPCSSSTTISIRRRSPAYRRRQADRCARRVPFQP